MARNLTTQFVVGAVDESDREPFFAGYGSASDFELFRLRLLRWREMNYSAHGVVLWPSSREHSQ